MVYRVNRYVYFLMVLCSCYCRSERIELRESKDQTKIALSPLPLIDHSSFDQFERHFLSEGVDELFSAYMDVLRLNPDFKLSWVRAGLAFLHYMDERRSIPFVSDIIQRFPEKDDPDLLYLNMLYWEKIGDNEDLVKYCKVFREKFLQWEKPAGVKPVKDICDKYIDHQND